MVLDFTGDWRLATGDSKLETELKTIANTFLKGLLFAVPIVFTFGIITWLFVTAEQLLRVPLEWVLPEGWYVTGMGVVSSAVLIFLVGLMVQAYLINRLFAWFEYLVTHIPIVKTLYNGAKDFLIFVTGGKSHEMEQVVRVTFEDNIHLIGFVTNQDVSLGDQKDLVSVYLPMSYMIGGYLIYVPKSRCVALDISAKQAMQQVLTANITGVSK